MSDYTDEDDDYGDYKEDFWGRTPQSSYFEIARTANQNIVEKELESVFRRLAVAEKMLEDRDLADEHEQQISALVIDEDIDGRTASIFIDLVGKIVTQCE
jgi:Mg-chelatase subunit ChlI